MSRKKSFKEIGDELKILKYRISSVEQRPTYNYTRPLSFDLIKKLILFFFLIFMMFVIASNITSTVSGKISEHRDIYKACLGVCTDRSYGENNDAELCVTECNSLYISAKGGVYLDSELKSVLAEKLFIVVDKLVDKELEESKPDNFEDWDLIEDLYKNSFVR